MATKVVGNPDVVDRIHETREIIDLVKLDQNSHVEIIAACTAVGKSALQRKIVDEIKTSLLPIMPIVVKTIPNNEDDGVSAWSYIDLVFSKMTEELPVGSLSFEHFFLYGSGMHQRRRGSNHIERFADSNRGRKFWKYLVGQLAKRATRVGNYDPEAIYWNDSIEGHQIKTQYIKYVFEYRRVLLAIDNMQNIDAHSLRELANCLNETKNQNHIFLLEYTLSSKKTMAAAKKLEEYFASTGASVELMRLSDLPSDYIIDAVHNNCRGLSNRFGLITDIHRYYTENAKGNIWQTVDYALAIDKPQTETSENSANATFSRIESLTDQAKFIIALIVELNGSLPKTTLSEVASLCELSLDEALEELHAEGMIKEADECLQCCHASIKSVWEKRIHWFDAYHQAARTLLIRIYERKLGEPSERIFGRKDDVWIPLLRLYSGYRPEKMETLLTYLETGIVKNLSPSIAWNFLEQFCRSAFAVIDQHVSQYWHVVKICFTCELYKEGYAVLEAMEKRTDVFEESVLLLNRAMFNSALDKHKENVDLYEKAILKYDRKTRVWLNLSLIVLSSFRSLGYFEQCRKIADQIASYEGLSTMYEYGIFLRLSDIYLERNEALPRLLKSVRFFRKRGDAKQEAKSLLSYSYVLAQLGCPKKAYRRICKAEVLLRDAYIGMHMVYTNQSMALLLDGCCDREVWDLLDKAESTAIVPFDKLCITLNKIAWCYVANRYDLVPFLEKTATDIIPDEPDLNEICLVYHNLYVVYEQMGSVEKAETYRLKADNLKKYCRPIQAKYDNKPTKETKYILERPWYAGGLAYWTYDLPEL